MQGAASRTCSKQHAAWLCSSYLAFSSITSLKSRWWSHTLVLTWLQLGRILISFYQIRFSYFPEPVNSRPCLSYIYVDITFSRCTKEEFYTVLKKLKAEDNSNIWRTMIVLFFIFISCCLFALINIDFNLLFQVSILFCFFIFYIGEIMLSISISVCGPYSVSSLSNIYHIQCDTLFASSYQTTKLGKFNISSFC